MTKATQPVSRSIWVLVALAIALCISGCGQDSTPAPSANSWRFVIFGDTRGDFDPSKTPPCDIATATGVSPVLPQIAAKIASLKPEFALHVGDLAAGDLYNYGVTFGQIPPGSAIPYADQFQAFKQAITPITAASIPTYYVRGNHEISCGDGIDGPPDPALAAAYQQAFGQYMPQNHPSQKGLTYSFSHKGVTVVAMDQYADLVPPVPAPVPWYAPTNADWGSNFWGYHTVDQTWVQAQLQAATTPFKIVMAHEPIFTATGVPASNPLEYSWSSELFFGPANFGGDSARQQFVDMMGNNGVQLYAVGHVHNLSVGSFNDSAGHTMYQLTAGNGGAFPMNTEPNPPAPEAALHNAQFELSRPGFTLVTVDPDANTMVMEYYVTSMTGVGWSKKGFTTTIHGAQ
jgi:hypothetical protein